MTESTRHGIRDMDDVPEAMAFIDLMRTHEQLTTDLARFFKANGLSTQQYNALRIIWHRSDEDGIPTLAVAERLINRVPDITRLLARLEKSGWIARRKATYDRRVVLVRLTPEGLELLRRLDHPLRERHNAILGHLTEDELNDLRELLRRARCNPLPE